MGKEVEENKADIEWSILSAFPQDHFEEMISKCLHFTDTVFEGLDVSVEIRSIARQHLGETVLLWDDGKIVGIALCHCGPGTEAGSGNCYIKFGAAFPGSSAEKYFSDLISACEKLSREKSLGKIVAGVNTARQEAYAQLLKKNFRVNRYGIAMQRPSDAGYNRPGFYIIDDWR